MSSNQLSSQLRNYQQKHVFTKDMQQHDAAQSVEHSHQQIISALTLPKPKKQQQRHGSGMLPIIKLVQPDRYRCTCSYASLKANNPAVTIKNLLTGTITVPSRHRHATSVQAPPHAPPQAPWLPLP